MSASPLAAGGDAEAWAPAPTEESAPIELEAQRARDQGALLEAERLLAENRARLRAAGIVARVAGDEDATVHGGLAGGVTGGSVGGASGSAAPAGKSQKNAQPAAPKGYGQPAAPQPTKRKDSAARAPTKKPASDPVAGDDAGGVCLRICDLSATTCELKARICELASRHEDDARYQEVCAQAEADCELASRACASCAA